MKHGPNSQLVEMSVPHPNGICLFVLHLKWETSLTVTKAEVFALIKA